jgi:hypothetical protein
LGPRTLTPYILPRALSSSSSSLLPASAKPLLIITAALTPFLPASSSTCGTTWAGTAMTTTSTGPGISDIDL